MFKMSEYSFLAAVLSIALALGCYVIAFASSLVAEPADDARGGGSRRRHGHHHGGPADLGTSIGLGTYGTLITWLALRFLTRLAASSAPSPSATARSRTCTSSRSRSRGAPSATISTSSGATTSACSACRAADRPAAAAVRGDHHRRLDRPARPGAPEQPAAVGPRRGRDRRLRHVHGRLRRRGPLPHPDRQRPPRPAQPRAARRDRATRR